MGGFKKGVSGNPAGRPVGSLSKSKKGITQMIDEYIEKGFEDFVTDLQMLDSKERCDIFTKLLVHRSYKAQDKLDVDVKINRGVEDIIRNLAGDSD